MSQKAGVLPPWIERPFNLISWLNMLEFSAERFYVVGLSLRIIVDDADKFAPDEKIGRSQPLLSTLKKLQISAFR